MFKFGKTPSYQSDQNFNLAIADDQKTLTVTFSDFKVTIGGSHSSAPISTDLFSLVLPLEGDGEPVEIEFAIQGFVLTLEGATVSVMLSVNGQSTITDFPANSEQSFLHRLKFTASSASECRLSILLLVGRDSKDCNAEAFLNLTAVDAEVLPRSQ
jgi:hypothetical protein